MNRLLIRSWIASLRCAGFAVLVVAGGLSGCGGATDVITPPPPPPTAFVIEFQADPEDAASAQALGWQTGIPGVEVSLRPADTATGQARTFQGNPQGTVSITDLPAGVYIASASRWLTAAERDKLGAGDDAVGFVVRATVNVNSSSRQAVPMPASRRRGLVISEWAFNHKDDYRYSTFLELANNADTTIYLDGVIIGEGFWGSIPSGDVCTSGLPFRNDPDGIWSREFARFPGTGREHPIQPGAVVVVASDAIDHRPFVAGGLDLRGADFELRGATDIDNPAVPDLEDLSLYPNPAGHGLLFVPPVAVPFVAGPVDVGSLPKRLLGKDWVRFPAVAVLDAVAIGSNFVVTGDCPPLVNSRFDRRESRVRGSNEVEEFLFSVGRRRVPGGGVPVLQHTRTGATDFYRSARTPGILP